MNRSDHHRDLESDRAFSWLLEYQDVDSPVDEASLAARFGEEVAAQAMVRWRDYRTGKPSIRGQIEAGKAIAVDVSDHDAGADHVAGADHDPSLADTESYLASTSSLDDSEVEPADSRDQHALPLSIGKFKLIKKLGRGAFGAVYLAEDTELQRQVALKIPHRDRIASRSSLERFFREARSAANLEHPSIVPVFEVGQVDGHCFIAAQYVQGQSLRHFLRTNKEVTPRQAAEIIRQLADAINHAHIHGIIHRDVKPENVMMDSQDRPRLLDFGLAQRRDGETLQTQEGVRLGTPSYMSPEQAEGKSHLADARSDMWALGVMLYEMLTGERPFDGGDTLETIRNVIDAETPSLRRSNAKVDRDLETICTKCLQKDPDRRYATCQHLAEDLRRYLEDLPIAARPISMPERTVRWCRRHPLPSAVMFIAVVSLASLVIYRGTRPAFLDLRVYPASASVTLDRIPLKLDNGQILHATGPGQHTLSISADGYTDVTKAVNLIRGRDDALVEAIELASKFGRVRIETEPTGAAVTLRRAGGSVAATGTTPFYSPRLKAGNYSTSLSKPLYESAEVIVSIPDKDLVYDHDTVVLEPTTEGAGTYAALERKLSRSRELLDSRLVDRSFKNTPLKEFISELSRTSGMPMIVDWPALQKTGISALTLVNLDLQNVSVKSALQLSLRALGLTYEIVESNRAVVLKVTTPSATRRRIQQVTFPVADIMGEEATDQEYRRMAEAIQTSISPDSWSSVGGPSTIVRRPNAQAFDVNARADLLERLYNYFADIRSVKRERTGRQPAVADLSERFVSHARSGTVIRQIRRVLSNRYTWDFDDEPIDSVIEKVSQRTGVPIHWMIARDEMPLDPIVKTVTLQAEQQRLTDTLRAILSPYQLTISRLDQGSSPALTIVNQDDAGDAIFTVVHDLSALASCPALAEFSAVDLAADRIRASMPSTGNSRKKQVIGHTAEAMLSVATNLSEHLLVDEQLEAMESSRALLNSELSDDSEDAGNRKNLLERIDEKVRAINTADPDAFDVSYLRRALIEFRRVHAGTDEFEDAKKLLQQLAWPVSKLSQDSIAEHERQRLVSELGQIPEEVVAVYGDSRLNHWARVSDVVFSPDGRYLASGGYDCTARLWDPNTGKEVRSFQGHDKSVRSVTFSADSSLIVTAGADATAILWNVADGSIKHRLKGHTGVVHDACFAASDRYVITVGNDKTIRVWDVDSGRQTRELKAHEHPVIAVVIDSAGEHFASSDSAGRVCVHQLAKETLDHQFEVGRGNANALAMKEDGSALAASGNRGLATVWDLTSGHRISQFKTGASSIGALAFYPGKEMLALEGPEYYLDVWDYVEKQHIQSLQKHTDHIRGCCFHPAGKMLASGADDFSVRVVDLSRVRWPGQKYFRTLRRGNLSSYQIDRSGQTRSVDISPDGRLIASVGSDGAVSCQLVSTTVRETWNLSRAYGNHVRFGPMYADFVSTAQDRQIRAWSFGLGPHGNRRIAPHHYLGYAGGSPRSFDISPKSNMIACSSGKSAFVFGSRPQLNLYGHEEEIRCVRYSPSGDSIATAGSDSTIRIWDSISGQSKQVLSGHQGVVSYVAYHPHGGRLLSVGRDTHVRLWDLKSGELLREAETSRLLYCAEFAPDGATFLTTGYDGKLRIWDTETFQELKQLQLGPKVGMIYQASFTPDGNHIITANGNGTIFVLRIAF